VQGVSHLRTTVDVRRLDLQPKLDSSQLDVQDGAVAQVFGVHQLSPHALAGRRQT
jgi:hypothetical protein